MEEHCSSLLRQQWGQTCDRMAGNLGLRDTWSLLRNQLFYAHLGTTSDMALTVANPRLHLSAEQLADLCVSRQRNGYHIYHQGDGVPTTNGYMFSLMDHPVGGHAEIAIAMEIAEGFKKYVIALHDYNKLQFLQPPSL
ncbi:hypothetical protein MTO96_032065 [Rhipicephalus appendiculatus]